MTSKGPPPRVLVYEHISGGGIAEARPDEALVREGDLMVRALVRDLAEAGAAVTTLRDRRLPDPGLSARIRWVGTRSERGRAWDREVHAAQAVLPVAPESGALLEGLSRAIRRRGRRLLGCHPEAVRIATGKGATAARLGAAGIATVATRPASHLGPGEPGPWVVKPEDGVGCDGVRLVNGPWHGLPRGLSPGPPEPVVQAFVPGEPVSLSLLCAGGRSRLLSVNRQWLTQDGGGFRFRGCTVNSRADDGTLARLGQAVAAAVPGLWGYVGVDLVLASDGPRILEVNPRPTTSYAGLHDALGANPGAWLLELARNRRMPHEEPRPREAVPISLETDRAG